MTRSGLWMAEDRKSNDRSEPRRRCRMHVIRPAFAMVLCFCAWWPAAYGAAGGDAFPQRPIRWIVPFPPGGSNDVLARYLGIKLGERLGEQIVIDNRGGANGIIGTDLA